MGGCGSNGVNVVVQVMLLSVVTPSSFVTLTTIRRCVGVWVTTQGEMPHHYRPAVLDIDVLVAC